MTRPDLVACRYRAHRICQISALLALVLGQGEQTVFQRLREWYLDGKQTSGKKRQEIEVSACVTPLVRWIGRLWASAEKRLPLVVDATHLGNRWTVLAVSVVLKGGAIPVAWKGLRAEAEGSWRAHGEKLFAELSGAIPADWLVIVLADRGLDARGMWDAIRACGWHPFLRINLCMLCGLRTERSGERIPHNGGQSEPGRSQRR